MHELTIRPKAVKGTGEVPVGTPGSILFVSSADLLVNGEPLDWYQALDHGEPVEHMTVEHYKRLANKEQSITLVEGPSLTVGDNFVNLTVNWPTQETLNRFGPEDHLDGSGPEALYLPVRLIVIDSLG